MNFESARLKKAEGCDMRFSRLFLCRRLLSFIQLGVSGFITDLHDQYILYNIYIYSACMIWTAIRLIPFALSLLACMHIQAFAGEPSISVLQKHKCHMEKKSSMHACRKHSVLALAVASLPSDMIASFLFSNSKACSLDCRIFP